MLVRIVDYTLTIATLVMIAAILLFSCQQHPLAAKTRMKTDANGNVAIPLPKPNPRHIVREAEKPVIVDVLPKTTG